MIALLTPDPPAPPLPNVAGLVALYLPADHPAHHESPERLAQALGLLDRVEQRAHTDGKLDDAYHESGHAVCALVLRARVHRVTIEEDAPRGVAGEVLVELETPEIGASPAERALLERELMIQLAGPEAQSLAGRPMRTVDWELHNLEGLQSARYFSPPMCQGEIDVYLGWLQVRVRHLLLTHWPAVAAVAYALLDRRTLTEHELHALVQPHLPAPPSVAVPSHSPAGACPS